MATVRFRCSYDKGNTNEVYDAHTSTGETNPLFKVTGPQVESSYTHVLDYSPQHGRRVETLCQLELNLFRGEGRKHCLLPHEGNK